MAALNIVFAGTPEFAVPTLRALVQSEHRIAAVYTQPDRPAGRGQQLHVGPIKLCAQQHGLPLKQPSSLRDEQAAGELAALKPDLMIVVAYGLLLPQAILDVPRLGCLNIHGSLLPRWRGAAPIHRAILARDAVTGVTIMRMEAGLDTGPILSTAQVPIGSQTNAAQLHDQLAELGADTLLKALPAYIDGRLKPQSQPTEGVTYAPKLKKEEALIDWQRSAEDLDAAIRAFNPWPVAETSWGKQQLRIWEASVARERAHAAPGTIVDASFAGIIVATGDGTLNLRRVQLPGRKPVTAADFANAHDCVGAVLGTRS